MDVVQAAFDWIKYEKYGYFAHMRIVHIFWAYVSDFSTKKKHHHPSPGCCWGNVCSSTWICMWSGHIRFYTHYAQTCRTQRRWEREDEVTRMFISTLSDLVWKTALAYTIVYTIYCISSIVHCILHGGEHHQQYYTMFIRPTRRMHRFVLVGCAYTHCVFVFKF